MKTKLLLIGLIASLVIVAGCDNARDNEILRNRQQAENRVDYIINQCSNFSERSMEYRECYQKFECLSYSDIMPIGFDKSGYFWVYDSSFNKSRGYGKYNPPAFFNTHPLYDIKLCEDQLCHNVLYQINHKEILNKCFSQNLVKSELGLIPSSDFNYLCRQNFLDYSCEKLKTCAIWNEDASRYLQTMQLKGCKL